MLEAIVKQIGEFVKAGKIVAFELKLEDGVGMMISSKGYRFTNTEGMAGRNDDVSASEQTMRMGTSREHPPDQMEKS